MSAQIEINWDHYLELEKLGLGVFAPLRGFMGEADFHACVERGRLASGAPFTIPIVLDLEEEAAASLKQGATTDLLYKGQTVGRLHDVELYRPESAKAVKQVFGTESADHPGVRHFLGLRPVFAGGRIELLSRVDHPYSHFEFTPEQTREHFARQGWKTIVGFQTRNVPHRAHEYLQKAALELCDGLLIQPLIGRKKTGDYTPEAIFTGYQALIRDYIPRERVLLAGLTTHMRYAGPREAAFHALIRRNYGCTHFVVGRDHAGVGGFYDKYAAHNYVRTLEDLGITVLFMRGPYFCVKCDSMTTDKTCPHGDSHPEYALEISGTLMRSMLSREASVDRRMMRPEVVESLRSVQEVFCK